MTAVALGVSSFHRSFAKTPNILIENMIVEKDPTNLVDGLVRFQRPGSKVFGNAISASPIRGVFWQSGMFDDDFLVVAGSSLYRVTMDGVRSQIGAVGGIGSVVIAGSGTRALIATGGICYTTDGVAVTEITMPASEDVRSVTYISGYFVLSVEDSQKCFWLAPGDVNPDALNFFSAETSPDNIERVIRNLDELWIFGTGDSTEVWQVTADPDLPFQLIPGRLYEKGCANKDSVVREDNTIFWVGTDGVVYRADTVPIRISDSSIEELIKQNGFGNLKAWACTWHGHTFYVLRVGTSATKVYDVGTGWVDWRSYGSDYFTGHLGAQAASGQIVFGSSVTGQLYQFDDTLSADAGNPLIRTITGGIAVLGAPTPCKSLVIDAAAGWADTGDPVGPSIRYRHSDDQGNTWTSWRDIPLGVQGQYGKPLVLTRLGMMRAPGRIIQLQMTDDSFYRISYARVNEPLP